MVAGRSIGPSQSPSKNFLTNLAFEPSWIAGRSAIVWEACASVILAVVDIIPDVGSRVGFLRRWRNSCM
jgi:hypothetical protein